MQGKRNQQEDFMTLVSLESMIPTDHIVRLMEKHIDFSFTDKRTRGLYSNKGRPLVDPQVLIRMMLIGYLHGITSERRLCQEVHFNLAYRWFCGLSLEDKVPHHSTFSKNRDGRFAGTPLFRELFYEIVQLALDKGLVRGKHLSTDADLDRCRCGHA
jgi:transposase